MLKELTLFYCILLALLYFPSCSNNEITEPDTPNLDSLSSILIDNIKNHSQTGELEHYLLPHNTEYDKIPADPKNEITAAKVELGMMLYHDPATGILPKDPHNYQTYSCASCHPADCEFQAGIEQGIGEGGWGYGSYGEGRVRNPDCAVEDLDIQAVKTPTALNMAYSNNSLSNGSLGATDHNVGTEHLWTAFPHTINALGFQGIETQAIAGITVHRVGIEAYEDSTYGAWVNKYGYKKYFDAAFPDVPEDERYTDFNMAMAMSAYERTMTASKAPFQDFLRGDYDALTDAQKKGGILFFGKAACAVCHTNPALGNDKVFISIGLNDLDSTRNFLITEQLGRGGFTKDERDNYKFKVPQLYNLMGVGEYGHGSSMHSLREMIMYCANGVPENPNVPSTQISKAFANTHLTKTEFDYLEDFVRSALYDAEIKRHQPERVMSGYCFPNADDQSKYDLGYKSKLIDF